MFHTVLTVWIHIQFVHEASMVFVKQVIVPFSQYFK